MKEWYKSGSPWVWMNAGAVTLCMVMVIGLLGLIGVRGLGFFWPSNVVEIIYTPPGGSETRLLGEVTNSETMTAAAMREAGFDVPEGQELVVRHLLKQGNRDITGRDFVWYLGDFMGEWRYPADVLVLERREWGNFYGYLKAVKRDGTVVAEGLDATDALRELVDRSSALFSEIRQLERRDIGALNARMERLRLEDRRVALSTRLNEEEKRARQAESEAQAAAMDAEYEVLKAELDLLYERAGRDAVVAETMDGRQVTISSADIVRATLPNNMGVGQKLVQYVAVFWDFLTGYPREANTEGGIFPALFGTVMMVMIMSVLVTPFGVLAAIYLREYAKQGTVVRIIRISVNNLAGVPSIVFGVFGLGFFVYFVGGNIDQLFYSESLPAPTFGTPGLMWVSLTLALLTLPVVIVSTEEGLARIPRPIREGSLALGATKAETLWRTLVPIAAPGMMTGLILAVARAAGEVAPLMLVGVVKLAPNLPVDSVFPFLHAERKIMHLGFHIFDVGFQSPNVEAARPLVYATALVLVMLIVVLNLTAITLRNRLRERYRSASD